MYERIKLTEKEMCNYYIKEQKVLAYGQEFFEDLCSCMMCSDRYIFVNNRVLPLSCYNELIECVQAIEQGSDEYIVGGFMFSGVKQSYIRIGIDTRDEELSEEMKKTIRHEIIHYYLWVLDYGHNDDDLDFWCMCYAYDGGAYEVLSEENMIFYNIFVSVFDDYVKDLQWNKWHLALQIMISGLHEYSKEEYQDKIVAEIESVKARP